MATQPHPGTARLYDFQKARAARERAAGRPAPHAPVIETGAWYHAAAIREAEPPRRE